MPTYQYACTACGNQLEAVQSFSDPALTDCPECQGRLRKVFNSVGIVFKGSGFYRNDSRSGEVSAEKPGSNDAAKKADSSSSSSSDSSSTPSTTGASTSSTSGSSSSGSSGSSSSGSSGSSSSGSSSGGTKAAAAS